MNEDRDMLLMAYGGLKAIGHAKELTKRVEDYLFGDKLIYNPVGLTDIKKCVETNDDSK